MVYSKSCSNIAKKKKKKKICLFRVIQLKANKTECPRLEQKSVIKFLLAEKCTP